MTCVRDDDDDNDDDDDDDDEQEAEELAAQARQLGTNIVRSHLQTHLHNNPDSSFVTWIATLHPENASVTIDDRFFIPGNPWQMVYEQAIKDQSAMADEPHQTRPAQTQQTAAAHSPLTPDSRGPTRELLRHCSPLDLLVGSSLTLLLVTVVVALEITAWIVYAFESIFSRFTNCLSPPSLAALWLYVVVCCLYRTFAMLDSILLLLSVGLSELIAAIQFCLSLCFGGCNFASLWHQSLRRTTHWIRVWFRAPCKNPKRHVFGKNVYAFVDWWNLYFQPSMDCHCSASAEVQQQYRLIEESAGSDEWPTAVQTATVYHKL